jgi:hypothetical protein
MRNLMVATINAGLDQGVFSLDPAQSPELADCLTFEFEFCGRPVLASVSDVGWDELSITANMEAASTPPHRLS